MPPALIWSPKQDATIRRMRAGGDTWDAIALAMSMSRWTLIVRGKAIGAWTPMAVVILPDDPDRDPLPAGHPDTWDVIVRGTCLAGSPYPAPGSDSVG